MLHKANNNFDFTRLIAAFGVIIAHSYALYGNEHPFYFKRLGEYSVRTFFVISGYLIIASILRSKNIQEYAKKRFLRIYPALFVLIIFSIFILGPIFTVLPLKEYFSNGLTWKYLRNLVFTINYSLPGVFEKLPLAETVNGSLWSLVYEVKFYFILAFIHICKWTNKKSFLYIFITTLCIFTCLSLSIDIIVSNNLITIKAIGKISRFMQGTIAFFIGCLIYLYRDKIKFNYKNAIYAVLAFIISVLFDLSIISFILEFTSFSYLVIYFARLNIPFISNFSRFGDYSYGVYLYGFPIQQALVALNLKYNLKIGFYHYIFLCIIASLACAFFSWHLVEKKFLVRKINLFQ
ncbi:MAG: acyltransferase [Sphingobacteriia bacterium]|nr:acyltransferase [Sphingobacteriia bacterium]